VTARHVRSGSRLCKNTELGQASELLPTNLALKTRHSRGPLALPFYATNGHPRAYSFDAVGRTVADVNRSRHCSASIRSSGCRM
jgi:hypothetical protein